MTLKPLSVLVSKYQQAGEQAAGGRRALKIPLVFARAWSVSLHCLMVICFLLLQCDVQGRCVLTWSNAVCSCGNDVSVLLFNGHVLGVVESRTAGAIRSEEQHPSSQQPRKGCQTPLCARKWQPCLVFHTVPITIPSPSILFLRYQRPILYLALLRSWSFHRAGCLCIPAPGVIKHPSVVIRLDASRGSDCQKVMQVAACRYTRDDEGATPSPWAGWFSAAPWAWWRCVYSNGTYSSSVQKAPKTLHTQSWGQAWQKLMFVPDLLGNLLYPVINCRCSP